MKRPEVDITNNFIPDYYRTHGPSRTFMLGFHGVCRAIFHPQVVVEGETREAVAEHLDAEKPIVYSLAHASWFDPVNYAAVIHKEKPFNKTIGNIVIPANAPLFNTKVIGNIITWGGAKPVIRRKDLFGKEAVITDYDKEAARIEANKSQTEQFVEYVNNGRHTAYFPEGTRNKEDRHNLLRFRRGMLELIKALDKPDDALIVMMSIAYGEGKKDNVLRPTVAVGHLAVGNAAELTANYIQAHQQELTDKAHATYRSRSLIIRRPKTARN